MYILIFLLPAICFFIFFMIYPMFKNFYNSFFYIKLAGPNSKYTFVGLSNFRDVISDSIFWKATRNTLTWAILSSLVEIPLGFILAFILTSETKGMMSRLFRNIWIMSVLLSEVMVGLLWTWVYQPRWGLLNSFLNIIGLNALQQSWLGNPSLALYCLILTSTWQWTGFNMILYLTGISSLPPEIIEASIIDGTNIWQRIKYIILPLLNSLTFTLLILCFVGKMKIFGLIWVATNGGPLWSTETVSTYVVRRAFFFDSFDVGFPSAIATLWFLVILSIVIFFSWVVRKKKFEQ